VNPLTNPRLFLARWLAQNDIEFHQNGDLKSAPQHQLLDRMWLDYGEMYAIARSTLPRNERGSLVKFDEKDLRKALDEHITLIRAAYREEIGKQLRCATPGNDKPARNALTRWIKAITGRTPRETELLVMLHWLWCVKRKFLGKEVVYHVMPVLYSLKQGNGKSTAIQRLTAPLRDFVVQLSMHQLSDDRCYEALSNNYICMFDEMQGAARTDVDQLKRIITASRIDMRRLYTNNVTALDQNCMFIGASNKQVGELIVDQAMRRFYQINCAERFDQAAINSIDYVELWQHVDDSRERGYLDEEQAREELAREQARLSTEDHIDTFLRDANVQPGSERVPFKRLYSIYREWCEENGHKELNNIWFARKLVARNLTTERIVLDETTGASQLFYSLASPMTRKPLTVIKEGGGQ
jgi:hypothetical protein